MKKKSSNEIEKSLDKEQVEIEEVTKLNNIKKTLTKKVKDTNSKKKKMKKNYIKMVLNLFVELMK